MDIASLGIEFDTTELAKGRLVVKAVKRDLDDLGDSADKTGARGKKSFNELGGAVSKFRSILGAAAIGLAMKEVIQATIENERNTKLLSHAIDTVGKNLGVTIGELKNYAKEMQNQTIFSDDAFLSSQRVFIQLRSVTKDTLPRATEAAADLASAWGTDVVDASTALARALKDPEEGLMMLNRQTRLFNDDQKKALKAMVDSGHAAEAQQVIIGRLEEEYKGTAAAAKDTLGGALAGLKNAFGDLMEGDGEGVTDLTVAIKGLTEAISDPNVIAGFQAFSTVVLGTVEGLVNLLAIVFKVTEGVGELFAKIALGGEAGFETAGAAQGYIDKLAKERRGLMESFGAKPDIGIQMRIKYLDDEIGKTEKLRRVLHEMELSRARAKKPEADGASKADEQAKAEAKALYEKMQAELAAAAAQKERDKVTKEQQTYQDDVQKQIREYNQALNDQAMAERELQQTLDPSLKMWAEYRAAIADAQEQFGDGKNPEAFGNAVANASAKLEEGLAGLEGIGDVELPTEGVNDLTASFDELQDAIYGVSTEYGKASGLMLRGLVNLDRGNGKFTKETLRGFGQIADGMQGIFAEGSKGYQAMGVLSKAFHAAELAATIAELVPKGISAVLTQGQGEPYSAPARMAAMAAFVAALGVGIGGMGGGGSSRPRPSNETGTGTVLGDPMAVSESIANSIAHMEDLAESELSISHQMLLALRSINAAITGASGLIARDIGLGGGQFGAVGGENIFLGGRTGTGPARLTQSMLGGVFNAVLPEVSGMVGNFVESLSGQVARGIFHARSRVTATGLAFDPTQSIGDIMGGGLDANYFQTVRRTNRVLGINTGGSTRTSFAGIDDELAGQLGSLVENLGTVVLDAVGSLGLDLTAATDLLMGMELGLGQINFRGMTGEEIEERLNAVFSNLGDRMAELVAPAIMEFQRVGEGMLETLVRVSAETMAVSGLLDTLGMGLGDMAALMKVKLTQALIETAGGIENLAESVSTFYDAFFTEEEKFTRTQELLTGALGQLGEELPSTRDGFRALVTGLDLSTEAGREAFVILTSLSGMADEYYGHLEDAEQERLDALEEEAEAMLAAAEASRKMSENIRKYLDSLLTGNLSTLTPEQKLAEAQSQFDTLLGRAVGGDLDAAGGIQGAASTLLSTAREIFASGDAYRAIFDAVTGSLDLLAGTLGAPLTTPALLDAANSNLQTAEVVTELQGLRQDISAQDQTIHLTVVTTDNRVVTEQTLTEARERSLRGELVIYATGVRER